MHTHELLDRFELLYADEKPVLADLRRAIIDDDLSSIFRVADAIAIQHENINDFRKAVMEKNLHAIFRTLKTFTNNNENDQLDDLRKAVMEKNLHSLFRLLPEFVKKAPLEDLRKAIVEENLHSIFRVLEEYQKQELVPLSMPLEDLRKSMLEENIHAIFRLLPRIDSENRTLPLIRKFVINKGKDGAAHIRLKELFGLIGLFHQPILLDTLWRVINSFPDANIQDAYSRGQILSKKWLIKELENLPVDLGTVFLCAGWYGTLSLMLFEAGIKITKIRSFDIDDEVWPIAETINRPYVMNKWQFKAQTEDICKINYKDGHTYNTYRRDGQVIELYDKPDTVINTSCEHIENFREWYDGIDKGTLVILQTNDYHEIEDHINCVDNIDQFKEMAPMTNCMYDGVLNLDKYNRFMLIGYR